MGQPAPKPQVSGRANLVNLELALHPVSWSLPYWDSAGILGPSRDPGTGQGSWDWTGICFRVGLEKGRAGTSSSMFSLLRRNSSKTTGGSQGSFWL